MFTRNVYLDASAPAFALLGVTLKEYGVESLEFEPALLRQHIEDDFNIKMSDLQMDKLQAAMCVMHTDLFFDDWVTFSFICKLFHNEPVDTEVFTDVEAEDIALALAEVALIRSSVGDESLQYDDEVRAFAGHAFHAYGFGAPPKIFPTAILPKSGNTINDAEKNAALNELFTGNSTRILDYIAKIQ